MTRWLGVLLAALLLAGCGSRVDQSKVAAESGLTSDPLQATGGDTTVDAGTAAAAEEAAALGDPSASGGAGGSATARTGRTGTAGAGGGAAAGGAGGETAAGGGTTGGSAGGGAVGQGVTDTEIAVGIAYTENADYANKAAGIEGVSRGDQKRFIEILLKEINDNGGVAGRKIKPVYHVVDGTAQQSTQEVVQAMCSTWTEDNKVFAALAGFEDSLNNCLHKAGVVQFAAGGDADSEAYARYPRYVDPAGIATERSAQVTIDQLVPQGYFETGYKLGLVSYEEPRYERAATAMKQALGRHGLSLSEHVRIKRATAYEDLGGETAAISSAVLQFKTAGVTHVTFLQTSNAYMSLIFLRTAQDQDYRPRYGWSSNDSPQLLSEIPAVPKDQMRRSLGVGWSPGSDVRASGDEGDTPAGKRCIDLMEKNGVTFPDGNSRAVARIYCEQFFFLKAAGDAAASLTADGLVAGAESLGSSYPSTLTARTKIAAGRHDGVAGFRHFAFQNDCECFRYTSGLVEQ